MARQAPDPLERVRRLDRLLVQMQRDSRMEAELARGRREFFGADQPAHPAGSEAATAAWLRFCEWFLLERDSENLGATPLVRFGPDMDEDFRASLQESLAGVFLVETVGEDLLQVCDLQVDVHHDVRIPAVPVAAGDVMVGRLYPGDEGLEPSAAMTVYRNGDALADAFRRDLRALGLERRLTQHELEHLMLARLRPPRPESPDTVPLERLEAALETLLESAGAQDSATDISADLRRAEAPGVVVAPLMERLAFETQIDLEKLRRILIEIWNAHSLRSTGVTEPPPAPEAPPSAEGLGEELVRTLDEGLRRSEDVEVLFARLAEMAGCDPEEGAPDTEIEATPDLGDLDPLIEEYLWETGQKGGPAQSYLEQWLVLQQNAPVPRIDLEYVTSEDLVRLLLHLYLGAAPRERAAIVKNAFGVLESFYRWAETTQEYEVTGVLERSRASILGQVDRLHAASLALSSSDRPEIDGPAPCMMRVEEVDVTGFGVRPDQGEPVWVSTTRQVASHLRVGDLVLGVLRRGPSPDGSLAGMVIVLPEEAESLVG